MSPDEARDWRQHPAWAYVLVLSATFFWAGNVTLGRALRFSAGPFTISAGRVCIAAVVFLFLMRSLPPAERRLGREWPWLAGMSLLGVVLVMGMGEGQGLSSFVLNRAR